MLDEHGTISPELLRRLMVAYGDVDRRDRAEVGSVLLYAMPTILARLDALAPLEAAAARVREAQVPIKEAADAHRAASSKEERDSAYSKCVSAYHKSLDHERALLALVRGER